MAVESASFISQLNPANPTASDLKSEGDDQIRLIKTAVQGSFPNLGATAVNTTAADLNAVTGASSTGASIKVVTQATADNSTNAASTALVTNKITAAALVSTLPNQTGNAGKFVTTDGTNASWGDITPTVTSVTTASNLTLTASSAQIQRVSFTANDLFVVLPDATTITSGNFGRFFKIVAAGVKPVSIADATFGRLLTLQPGQSAGFTLASNTTAAGVWTVVGESVAAMAQYHPGTSSQLNGTALGQQAVAPLGKGRFIMFTPTASLVSVRILTRTSTGTFSTGTPVNLSIGAATRFVAIQLATDRVVLAHRSAAGFASATLVDVVGSTITERNTIALDANSVQRVALCHLKTPSATKCVIAWSYVSTNSRAAIAMLNISGNTISAGTLWNAGDGTGSTPNSLAVAADTAGGVSVFMNTGAGDTSIKEFAAPITAGEFTALNVGTAVAGTLSGTDAITAASLAQDGVLVTFTNTSPGITIVVRSGGSSVSSNTISGATACARSVIAGETFATVLVPSNASSSPLYAYTIDLRTNPVASTTITLQNTPTVITSSHNATLPIIAIPDENGITVTAISPDTGTSGRINTFGRYLA